MSLLTTPPCSSSSLFLLKTQNLHHHNPLSSFSLLPSPTPLLSLSSTRPSSRTFLFSRSSSSSADDDKDDEWGQEPKSKPNPPSFTVGTPDANISIRIPGRWGEKFGSEPEPEAGADPEPEPESRFTEPDPPIREDEDSWGPPLMDGVQTLIDNTGAKEPLMDGVQTLIDNSGAKEPLMDGVQTLIDSSSTKENKKLELKRCLLDSVYGSDLGFRASAEVRAEISELVTQLEAVNPSPNPTDVPGLLDGNWILVYTAFSELLPLLAAGATPLLKVQQISQAINSANQTVENSTTLSTPFATFSFSATASFDVRSSSRIQVRFKEATFKPPEIKSRFDLPENIEVFGQSVTLSPVQQLLNPVQEAAASISRGLYGLPPLKIPIPGERTASWLLFTYVDEDFRISRGDGGIFVLVREGSPLLDQ